jgi:tetratricopeptide (TPR) repeat protein
MEASKKKKFSRLLKILVILIGLVGLAVGVYFIPPVHDRLSWRLANLRAKIYYFFNPPGETSFNPEQQAEMEDVVGQTQTALVPTSTATIQQTITPTNYISPTFTQTATPTPSPTPIPDEVRLEGVVHEYEKFNNCGPATLSMALSYWGWQGNQTDTADWLKPNWHDRNVMPYELLDYVESETEFKAVLRYGGEIELIKNFIAAGFPVVIERGFEDEVPQKEWMGHYGVITAYDDSKEQFLIQDSYVMEDYPNDYEYIERHWRSFNYVYMVIYPATSETDIFRILGPHIDEVYNYKYAADKALQETAFLDGRELFFAWYNYGTNLKNLYDYFGAAQAYDKAYEIKNQLWPAREEPITERYDPWRIIWYQTGPYFAYFNTGRYQDVIDLANETFADSIEDAIEESWVWRGRAKVKLGDNEGAIEDFREALVWHPGWWVAEQELRNLGVQP